MGIPEELVHSLYHSLMGPAPLPCPITLHLITGTSSVTACNENRQSSLCSTPSSPCSTPSPPHPHHHPFTAPSRAGRCRAIMPRSRGAATAPTASMRTGQPAWEGARCIQGGAGLICIIRDEMHRYSRAGACLLGGRWDNWSDAIMLIKGCTGTQGQVPAWESG